MDAFSICSKFIGKVCWDVVASPRSGSIISLNLGNKIQIFHCKTGQASSLGPRGEFEIFIECYWELHKQQTLLCTADDSAEENGPILNGIKSIINQKIEFMTFSNLNMDLGIEFENRSGLNIYAHHNTWGNNSFTLFTPEINIKIFGNGEIKESKPDNCENQSNQNC